MIGSTRAAATSLASGAERLKMIVYLPLVTIPEMSGMAAVGVLGEPTMLPKYASA